MPQSWLQLLGDVMVTGSLLSENLGEVPRRLLTCRTAYTMMTHVLKDNLRDWSITGEEQHGQRIKQGKYILTEYYEKSNLHRQGVLTHYRMHYIQENNKRDNSTLRQKYRVGHERVVHLYRAPFLKHR